MKRPPGARIFDFNDERDDIVREVAGRVWGRKILAGEKSEDAALEYVLNDVAYHEIQRYEKSKDSRSKGKASEWRELARALARMPRAEKESRVRTMVQHFARDIVGNFDPKVYSFASRILPAGLTALLHPQDLRHGFAGLGDLERHVTLQGDLETLRTLATKATLVFVPVHISNLDSIVVGFSLMRANLPPATYGAGKNLFTNPFLSFFMRNLGAYRVDRRIRHGLYKDVLKEYSAVLIERGYHSLFFPGGTRSRSGMVETKLKLGLVGTCVDAYVNNQIASRGDGDVFLVPVTINYPLVLEADTLAQDYLAAEGKSRYIIEDDEFSRLERLVTYVRQLMGMESSIVLHYSHPLDVFGNRVGHDKTSYDRRGRPVDRRSYVTNARGEVVHDGARDREYTRALGERVAEVYQADTVIMPTNLLAFAVFELCRARFAANDLYRLLRVGSGARFSLQEVENVTADLQREVRKLSDRGGIRLAAVLSGRSAEAVVRSALSYFAEYHTVPAILADEDNLRIGDMSLLYYYRNRLATYGLESVVSSSATAFSDGVGGDEEPAELRS